MAMATATAWRLPRARPSSRTGSLPAGASLAADKLLLSSPKQESRRLKFEFRLDHLPNPSVTLRTPVSLSLVLVASMAGWLVVFAPWVALGCGLLFVGLLLVVAGRLALSASNGHIPTAYAARAEETVDHLVWGRRLFYAGMLTISWLQLRIAGFTISDYLFFAALLAVVVAVSVRPSSLPRLPVPLVIGLALFVAGSLIATLFASQAPAQSAAAMVRFVYLLTAWLAVSVVVLRTPSQVRTAVACLVTSVAICGVWAVMQKVGLIPSVAGAGGRVSGLADHVNALGAMCAIALVPTLVLLRSRAGPLWAIAALAIVAGLFLSGSIGASVAATGALLAGLVSPRLARIAVVGAVVSGLVLFYFSQSSLLDASPLERLDTVADPQAQYGQATLYSRIGLFTEAWQGIKSSPVVGVGLDEASSTIYSPISGDRHQVHNLILGPLYEGGLLSGLGVVIILCWMVTLGVQTVIRVSSEDRLLAVGLLAALTAVLIVGIGEPLLYQRYALAPVALLMALAGASRRRH